MKKLLTAAAALALLATPVLAQTTVAPKASDELKQDQVRPGVLGPGVDAVTKDGQVIPGGDVEAKTGGDGNVGKTLSGGSGLNDDRATGAAPSMDNGNAGMTAKPGGEAPSSSSDKK